MGYPFRPKFLVSKAATFWSFYHVSGDRNGSERTVNKPWSNSVASTQGDPEHSGLGVQDRCQG